MHLRGCYAKRYSCGAVQVQQFYVRQKLLTSAKMLGRSTSCLYVLIGRRRVIYL